MMLLSVKLVADLEQDRPGIAAAVEAAASGRSASGRFFILEPKAWAALQEKFAAESGPDGFVRALTRWIRAGRPIASEEVRALRYAICAACEFWDPSGWLGLGACRACGCSRIKLSLATACCPLKPPKWRPVPPPPPATGGLPR